MAHMKQTNTKITIAIDGHSSTGKSTIAKDLAKRLGYVYVDSGAMYRAVTLYALQNQWIGPDFFDTEVLKNRLDDIAIRFVKASDTGLVETFLNGLNVESQIRSLHVSNYVSRVAALPEVREHLVKIQKKIGLEKGVVMDGRDIGTVVFPDAELKLFLTASASTRAKRRFDELEAKGEAVTFEAILENVLARDHLDTHRAVSPLVKAADAVEIDNSALTREKQAEKVYQLAVQALERSSKSRHSK